MLWAFFATSTALLSGCTFLAYRRLRAGHVHTSALHTRLDRATVRALQAVREGTAIALHFARSDVLLKGLHMVTYVALVFVRFVERQLVHVVHALRSFRKERAPRRSTHKLARLHSEESGDMPK
jgi:hypothetical protein